MSVTTHKPQLDEAKIALLLVRRKVITDGQLKAAMDYHRSLGGKITDVLVKLDLVRQSQIDDIVRNPDAADGPQEGAPHESALPSGSVKPTDLKVHRRLLDKLPAELVDRYLILLFFPVPSGDPRKIVLGHGRHITQEVAEKVRSIVGVDLCTLPLEEKVAKDFLSGEQRRESAKNAPAAAAPRPEPAPARIDHAAPAALATAILSALVKKGILTRQDVEAELAGDAKAANPGKV